MNNSKDSFLASLYSNETLSGMNQGGFKASLEANNTIAKRLSSIQSSLQGFDHHVFVHVPRTGGSAFLHFIFENFGRDYVLDTFVPTEEFAIFKKIFDNPELILESNRFVHVHVPVNFQNFDRMKRCGHFTIFRQPLDRLLSSYYHYLSVPPEFIKTDLLDTSDIRQIHFIDFLFKNRKHPEIGNPYAKYLAATTFNDSDGNRYPKLLAELPLDELKERALAGLNKFYFVGIHEYFSISIKIFALLHEDFLKGVKSDRNDSDFLWPKPMMRSGSVTTTRTNTPLDINSLDMMIELNSIDCLIYEYCLNQFVSSWGFLANLDSAGK